MAATCMAVCKGSRKKIRGIFISSCHLPVAVECDIVILSEPGPIPQAPVGQFCRHNLSPRGDGNLWMALFNRTLGRDTTYPREGTETRTASSTTPSRRTQLIPARGRKQGGNLPPGGAHRTQLIPARGRKRERCRGANISKPTQLIPARGRKHGGLDELLAAHDTTYPREGTETVPKSASDPRSTRHNLSPRGDGNNRYWTSQDCTFPRHNLSPRGDGNPTR